MAQLCNDISPLLSQVETLEIYGAADHLPEPPDNVEAMTWLNLFRPFTGLKHLSVSHVLVSVVARALQRAHRGDGHTNVTYAPWPLLGGRSSIHPDLYGNSWSHFSLRAGSQIAL